MSRVANIPIDVPPVVEVKLQGQLIMVRGPQGSMEMKIHPKVNVDREDNILKVRADGGESKASALAGTTRALIANMVTGVVQGFEKRLQLVGVGYRAQLQGKVLNLSLGFSHPINYAIPQGVTIETPSQTEIVIKGVDKQKVGQIAAEIRLLRPPEPYKGKGVRYTDERVVRKEAKKK